MIKIYETGMVKVKDLVAWAGNVNVLKGKKFDKLVEEIRVRGFREPIQVIPIDDGKYQIIGGHHRVKACELLGVEEIPAVIYPKDEWDEDAVQFESIRLNMLHGFADPVKFTEFVKDKREKYGDDVIQDMLAVEDKEWNKLLIEVERNLPDAVQEKFKEAKKQIKTIDQLAEVISKIMSDAGTSIDRGYVFFQYDGKTALMINMDKKNKKIIDNIVAMSEKSGIDINDIIRPAWKDFESETPEYIQEEIDKKVEEVVGKKKA